MKLLAIYLEKYLVLGITMIIIRSEFRGDKYQRKLILAPFYDSTNFLPLGIFGKKKGAMMRAMMRGTMRVTTKATMFYRILLLFFKHDLTTFQ